MLDHLKIDKAHFVGLSMGGYTVLQVALDYPNRALSIVPAGAGSGSERAHTEQFRVQLEGAGRRLHQARHAQGGETYGLSPARIPFVVKDPRGFEEFNGMFSEHDALGCSNTMRGFQAERPSIYDFEDRLRKITVPTLIVVGDEDEPCMEPSFLLKQWMPTSGLVVVPKTGHVVNQEEPARFNEAVAISSPASRPGAGPRAIRGRTGSSARQINCRCSPLAISVSFGRNVLRMVSSETRSLCAPMFSAAITLPSTRWSGTEIERKPVSTS